MQETLVRSLGQQVTLEKEMTPDSSIIAWKIPWIEEPGGHSLWAHKSIRHDLGTKLPLPPQMA